MDKCAANVKCMQPATFLQKNFIKGMKNGLMEPEETPWSAPEEARRVEVTALPAKSTTNVKRIAGSQLQSELGKKRKEDGACERDLTQILCRPQKKKAG